MSSLPPRIALITGAAQGIGLEIALRLADDGYDVAVNDLGIKAEALQEVVSQIQAKGRRSMAAVADVSVEDDVRDMVNQVVDGLGGLDVMVANAGIVIVNPMVETTAQEWDQIMSVNLRGVMLNYKYAAQQMIKQRRGGRIIG
ncbi:hypothetical protein CERSUDRAFT_95765 [Gelatoporia subvermispora B]|uniref:Uncharacterized protein n=1 Tax=Ceriporiopsis subvermispora (strain B) TaxID=914234 RepID=M2RCF0_CERS8|nr:hypothetical protein CERSUDRAFT_95765 [Gelatoporia subvermispora B]